MRSFTARSLAGYELEVQVDGDGAGTTPVTVGPAGGKVRFLVPPGAGRLTAAGEVIPGSRHGFECDPVTRWPRSGGRPESRA